jgi:Brix domain
MNGFTAGKDVKPPPELTLLTSTFQNLFPALSAHTTPISSIRRVLLCNRTPLSDDDEDGHVIDIRHFSISTNPIGQPRAVRKTSSKAATSLPNLAKFEDVADFVLRGNGYDSASEVEEVEKVEIEKQGGPQQRAIRLAEIGPRLRLELVKIEEGMCDGKVMYHRYVHKTKVPTPSVPLFHGGKLKWFCSVRKGSWRIDINRGLKRKPSDGRSKRRMLQGNWLRKRLRGQKRRWRKRMMRWNIEENDEEVQDEDEMLLEPENELHGN